MILIRLVVFAFSSLFFMAVTATALAGFLVLSGAPHPCVDRSVTPAPSPNAALQANWSDVIPRVDAGQAVALSVTEAQATTLAQTQLEDKNVPVQDLQILFCPDGSTEALGKVTIAGLTSDVLVKGHLDISSVQPQVQIDSIQAGNLPSLVAQRLLNLVWDGQAARTLPVTLHILSLDVHDGEAIVVVGP